MMLQELNSSESNICLKRCDTPKYVFLVDPRANKKQIAQALEEIYAERKIKVLSVNTINVKSKPKRVRGKHTYGKGSRFKKAIVTLKSGDSIED